MQDVFETIHADSPTAKPVVEERNTGPSVAPLPVIQVGLVTSTDELFEIVRQRIRQVSEVLLPLAASNEDTASDFGHDSDDDADNHAPPPDEELTGLQLVFQAFTQRQADKINRLRFQAGLDQLLQIQVSWHQFDLLFRRLDLDLDGELSAHEFTTLFRRDFVSFDRDDILFLQEGLVNYVIERLESRQWTLPELFQAFDRDGSGVISIAEFSTLVRFLFTAKDKQQLKRNPKRLRQRHVYLLMSCLDVSSDHRISQQEFLRFFFIVWSTRLMEVQDQLADVEAASSTHGLGHTQSTQREDRLEGLRGLKKTLRRALRTNFSRPFRDAMRCQDAAMPGPFAGLLHKLQLVDHPAAPMTASTAESGAWKATADTTTTAAPLQVWQVLQGQTSTSHRGEQSMTQLYARTRAKEVEESRRRVQKGKNEVARTRLTRDREPERANALFQTPDAKLVLDDTSLKFDHRPKR
ncbi:TPA: hypothetical protein N0F65_007257 [Lagenidium giganteum]|uniref:EF-hand domain-containing protein n=1 Tax=Lagenidium giganteum TaxID=4803 RepID=A0AAV2YW68_9STRA|nr:TPA: hypothetical protein N0F65_007257 [Lagenidium giganteum]